MRKILLSLSAIALVAFVACSKSESPEPAASGNGISFNGLTAASKVSVPNAADQIYQFEWNQGDEITIWYTTDGGSTFSLPGIYKVTEAGPSSPFEYFSGNELEWDGTSTNYTFVAMYPNPTIANLPSPVYNAATNAISIGVTGSIINNATNNMTQAVVDVPDQITVARAVMRAKVDVAAPTGEETVTQAVNLDFEHGFAYLELRMTGDDPADGRKVSSINIKTSSGSVYVLPAGDANKYDPWTNTFPNYWPKYEFNLVFGTPFTVSSTVQKGWAPICPGNQTGNTLTFTITYTSGPAKVLTKSGVNIVAGTLQPVVLDVTPPELFVPTYTLTIPVGSTVSGAIALAKTNGDITNDFQIKDIVYQANPGGTIPAADATSLQTLLKSGSIDSITITAAANVGSTFAASTLYCNKVTLNAVTAIPNSVFQNNFNRVPANGTVIQYLDYGTAYGASYLEQSENKTYFLVPSSCTTLKFGHTGVVTQVKPDIFGTAATWANIDLYLGADEITALGGLPVNPPVWQGKTWKSINAY